jgi:diguanylate cyclase (GGDEF)-like protein
MGISFANIFVNGLSLIVLLFLISLTVKYRNKHSSIQLTILLLFLFLWALGSFIEINSIDYNSKLFWRNITQIGVFMTPFTSILFVAYYADDQFLLNKKLLVSLFLIQLSSIVLIETNTFHYLMRQSVELITIGDTTEICVKQTVLGKIMVSFNYFIMILVEIRLAIFRRKTSRVLKRQVSLIMLGMFLPMFFGILKASLLEKNGIFIPISTLFIPGGLCLILGVLRYELFSISPIARDKVFDVIEEGIVICSPEGKVVDINPIMQRILGAYNLNQLDIHFQNKEYSGCEKMEMIIHSFYKQWYHHVMDVEKGQFEIELQIDNEIVFYDIKVYILKSLKLKNLSIGTISIVREITEEKKNIKLLKLRAERDNMTNIYTRLYFVESVNKLLNFDDKQHNDAFLLVLDIDFFKKVNDAYGHSTGDDVLIAAVKIMTQAIRQDDLIGRIGGEEFAIFLSDTSLEKVLEIAERIRKNIEKHHFDIGKETIKISISIGIAIVDSNSNYDDLFIKADKALYQAKESGRNKIVYYKK